MTLASTIAKRPTNFSAIHVNCSVQESHLQEFCTTILTICHTIIRLNLSAGVVRALTITIIVFYIKTICYRQVFQFLANNGALENTVVIIAADHGQAFREHGYIGHLDCNYIETVSVPMMFFIPKEVQKNFKMDVFKRNLAENHALVDIIPTLLTLLGIDNEPDIKSYSIKFAGRSLFENDSTNRDIIICNSHEISESNVGLSLVRLNMHYIFRTNITPPQKNSIILMLTHGTQ